ncbi:MAG: TetR/AcrR family transcriptional regulator [Actinomycetota bacterium]
MTPPVKPTTTDQSTAPRSDTRSRLEKAALDLFVARGYDNVSPTEIAAAAGVSERTFFRHFPTKLDSLMGDQAERFEWFFNTLRSQPAELTPLEAVLATIELDELEFPADRRNDAIRGQLILATPTLNDAVRVFEGQTEEALGWWLAERTGRTIEDYEVRVVAAALTALRRVVINTWIEEGGARPVSELAARALHTMTLTL